MSLEVVAAALVGLAAVCLVLQPLIAPGRPAPPVFEPLDPEETPRGVALAALKEIEFDRETGKLSDEDYAFLKGKYTGVALEALRAEAASEAARRCRGHDRGQGSGPSLRCDLGTARRAGVSGLWPASGARRGVLLLLRPPPARGRGLRGLRGRARPRQPVLRSVRHRRGGVSRPRHSR